MQRTLCLICCIITSVVVLGKNSEWINFGEFSCPRDEEVLSRCLRDILNSYVPKLVTGIPEYNVPPCEPLMIPNVTIAQSTGPFALSSTYTDVAVRGPSRMKVTDVRVDFKEHQVAINLHIPELKLTGHYQLDGHALIIPIKSHGSFAAKYNDVDALVTIKVARHRPAGRNVESLKCKSLRVYFYVGQARMELDKLFGDDKELGKKVNNFLNENWQTLAEELQGPLEDALRDCLKPLADHVFDTLNADEILGH